MEHYLSELPIPVYIHDFTVDVGLPEHLERLANQVRASVNDLSFPNFMAALDNISKAAPKLRIDDTKEFELKFNNGVLEI